VVADPFFFPTPKRTHNVLKLLTNSLRFLPADFTSCQEPCDEPKEKTGTLGCNLPIVSCELAIRGRASLPPDSWILAPDSSRAQGLLFAATLAGPGSATSTREPSIMESDGSAITASFAGRLEVTSTALP